MSLIQTLETIEGTAALVKRHHAGLIMLFYWNIGLTFALIWIAVRHRRKP